MAMARIGEDLARDCAAGKRRTFQMAASAAFQEQTRKKLRAAADQEETMARQRSQTCRRTETGTRTACGCDLDVIREYARIEAMFNVGTEIMRAARELLDALESGQRAGEASGSSDGP